MRKFALSRFRAPITVLSVLSLALLVGCKMPAPGVIEPGQKPLTGDEMTELLLGKGLIEPGQKPLTGDEIKKLLVGNSFVGSTQSGGRSATIGLNYTVFYPSYDEIRGAAVIWTDQGVWSVRGNIYCSTWDHWFNNEEACYRVYKKGNKVF